MIVLDLESAERLLVLVDIVSMDLLVLASVLVDSVLLVDLDGEDQILVLLHLHALLDMYFPGEDIVFQEEILVEAQEEAQAQDHALLDISGMELDALQSVTIVLQDTVGVPPIVSFQDQITIADLDKSRNGRQCVTLTNCQSGQYWNGAYCVPISYTCSAGYQWNGNNCVTNPQLQRPQLAYQDKFGMDILAFNPQETV